MLAKTRPAPASMLYGPKNRSCLKNRDALNTVPSVTTENRVGPIPEFAWEIELAGRRAPLKLWRPVLPRHLWEQVPTGGGFGPASSSWRSLVQARRVLSHEPRRRIALLSEVHRLARPYLRITLAKQGRPNI